MIPTKPGFYWVTDISRGPPERTIVELYPSYGGHPRRDFLSVSFLGSDMDHHDLTKRSEYLRDWDGPIADPRAT